MNYFASLRNVDDGWSLPLASFIYGSVYACIFPRQDNLRQRLRGGTVRATSALMWPLMYGTALFLATSPAILWHMPKHDWKNKYTAPSDRAVQDHFPHLRADFEEAERKRLQLADKYWRERWNMSEREWWHMMSHDREIVYERSVDEKKGRKRPLAKLLGLKYEDTRPPRDSFADLSKSVSSTSFSSEKFR